MGNQFRRIAGLAAAGSCCALLIGCSHQLTRHDSKEAFRWPSSKEPAPETRLLQKLMWPVATHRVTQEFRSQNGDSHDGIDIPAKSGTRIYAPAGGRVLYSGQRFHGYGKMIIIEHNSELATIYGHCQKLLVRPGDYVRRGSLIGLVGRTGRASAPHLHFEVRLNREPVDPRDYLP